MSKRDDFEDGDKENPFEDLLGGLKELGGHFTNNIFSHMLDGELSACHTGETKKDYIVRCNVPRMRREDVDVEVHGRMLKISGTSKVTNEEEDNEGITWHRKSKTSSSFSQSFKLPEGIHNEDIQARFNNGTLTVSFPKPQDNRGSRGSYKVNLDD
eukprot:TRINITY_DN7135_c0_g1_i1.p1 TRINITY_DN7135_c0_g1~~TRINITY_DN7135_c0_g1_i1.p1  ORF type:complete len:156 (-),score=14.27 TRINITY_DN7135_c0_g1_i1:44-511(-)